MFLAIAIDILPRLRHDRGSYREKEQLFKAHFGVSPLVTDTMWSTYLLPNGLLLRHSNVKKKHLLWSLFFLFSYTSEDVACSIMNTNRKTYRKWIWIVVMEISLVLKDIVSTNT